jgi:Oxidoreductase molybdopterin binding domain
MRRTALLAFLLAAASCRLAAADPALTVLSPDKTLSLTAEDLRRLPHREVTATNPHDKGQHRYSGVLVRDLLAQVGAPMGEKLRGPALRLAVIVHSRDGYGTLFALAEFDDAFSDRDILLADAEDGAPIADGSGPLRLVAPGDKRAARWVRMVASLEVVRPGAGP